MYANPIGEPPNLTRLSQMKFLVLTLAIGIDWCVGKMYGKNLSLALLGMASFVVRAELDNAENAASFLPLVSRERYQKLKSYVFLMEVLLWSAVVFREYDQAYQEMPYLRPVSTHLLLILVGALAPLADFVYRNEVRGEALHLARQRSA